MMITIGDRFPIAQIKFNNNIILYTIDNAKSGVRFDLHCTKTKNTVSLYSFWNINVVKINRTLSLLKNIYFIAYFDVYNAHENLTINMS